MKTLTVEVSVSGIDVADGDLQRYRNAIADRRPLHASMAVQAANFTRDFLIKTPRHKTAEKLGAAPTGFRAKNAKAVHPDSDGEMAMVRIPRNTGLGRAFHDVVIRPGSGRKYLTIPAHQETYGRSVRDFPEDTFKFAMLISIRVSPVLMFADGPYKDEVGFWLQREVKQKQDRSLLPSNDAYAEVGRRAAVHYIQTRISQAA